MATLVIPQDHRTASDDHAAFKDRPGPKNESSSDTRPSADHVLESLGYAPELRRNRSTVQVAFMSFVLAAIPFGLATTMYYPLAAGGAANIVWGWLLVSCIILSVAVSLGEITSVYPTAGGVYYQTYMLAPHTWRRAASWVCGWLYLVGNITITLAVNFGTALFLVACVNIFDPADAGQDLLFPGETWQVFLIFLAITLLCNAVSALGDRWLPVLDSASIFCTFASLISIVVCILVLAKNGRHSARYVFTSFEPRSGWPPGWSFCVGLLQAAYATSSTGMIISMCEEVRAPATQVPKAMVFTIGLNTLAGLLTLVPMVFVLPDIDELLAIVSGQPVPMIIKSAVGSAGGSFALLTPMLMLGLSCGIGCTTAASRCVWAFARDGAVPGSGWWRRVHPRLTVPLNAMMLSMAIQVALALIYFGSTAAFNAFSGVGVICLTTSYAIPVAISVLGRRRAISHAPFHLGTLGLVCNCVCIAWSLLAVPLFCMPTMVPVTAAANMNYASVVFVGFTVISIGWYMVWGHANYAGPPT